MIKIENRKKKKEDRIKEIAKNIKLLILDVDGVLTDGSIILDNEGNEFKVFNVRDGHGIKMLEKADIQVAIITGRYSKVIERRAKELGIKEVYQRCHIKSVAFDHLIEKLGLRPEEIAYAGDDIVDIPIFRRVGLSIAVSDATEETKKEAMIITKNRGGKGAVREICEFLIKSKGLWDSIAGEYIDS